MPSRQRGAGRTGRRNGREWRQARSAEAARGARALEPRSSERAPASSPVGVSRERLISVSPRRPKPSGGAPPRPPDASSWSGPRARGWRAAGEHGMPQCAVSRSASCSMASMREARSLSSSRGEAPPSAPFAERSAPSRSRTVSSSSRVDSPSFRRRKAICCPHRRRRSARRVHRPPGRGPRFRAGRSRASGSSWRYRAGQPRASGSGGPLRHRLQADRAMRRISSATNLRRRSRSGRRHGAGRPQAGAGGSDAGAARRP